MLSPFPFFCCPLCKGDLKCNGSDYHCAACEKHYPVVLGIPDFRVFPDPYISYKDDYKKAKYLLDKADKDNLDFKSLVRLYWKITPEVSPDRAELFTQRVFQLTEKGKQGFREIKNLDDKYQLTKTDSLVEIGCGTGGFLVAAKNKFKNVVGADIAFRWLVIARKRLEECGLNVPLVCCCAEYLPFKDDIFDLAVAENVIEHIKEQSTALGEVHRVLKKDGKIFITTPNRFSIASEPHVRVWGVGFLPRRWMQSYVKLIKAIPYRFIKILSLQEMKSLLKESKFTDCYAFLPSLTEEEIKNFPAFKRGQANFYECTKKLPFLKNILLLFGPAFRIIGFARKDERKIEEI